MLIDNHNRKINYLRLAVTDRCNLRCNYCMPESGINFAENNKLLSIEELITVSENLVELGIDKIRITGGEPFVRKDLMVLMRKLAQMKGLKDISVTTNATLIENHIDELKALGITNVNLSLDAINKETFEKITRRSHYEIVHRNLLRLIDEDFNIRINFVVLDGQNTQDILPILELTKHHHVSVRFLEEMPFNGGSRTFNTIKWDYKYILAFIQTKYPDITLIPSEKTSTSINYKIKNHVGSFGLIPSFSRTFCGSCNRLRISATGDVITCLYGKPVTNIREVLRANQTKENLKREIQKAISTRAANGFEAQQQNQGVFENSMTSIGG
ncbi:MAG: GTP 3',8-cyclase MoaA [Flavobacteriaceae bacterium]|nr:GTP 3',8-cyclase MoaA [Flavobacteriaceae bacterium]